MEAASGVHKERDGVKEKRIVIRSDAELCKHHMRIGSLLFHSLWIKMPRRFALFGHGVLAY